MSIVHDESIVSFLREGLNIRHSYNIYRNLEKYVDFVQQEAAAGKDISRYQLDDHFTSGVALGIGCFNVILSLLPTTVVKVAEFMGFSSDREHGLSVLESIGGWDEYRDAPISQMPELQGADEGLRRQLCDMFLIMYHIVLSKMVPLSNVDQGFAERILNYNLKLYPSGVFFLYFSGRLLASQGKLEESKNRYNSAIKTQQDWKQLQHICYWEVRADAAYTEYFSFFFLAWFLYTHCCCSLGLLASWNGTGTSATNCLEFFTRKAIGLKPCTRICAQWHCT